jgi:hypothetical protein
MKKYCGRYTDVYGKLTIARAFSLYFLKNFLRRYFS